MARFQKLIIHGLVVMTLTAFAIAADAQEFETARQQLVAERPDPAGTPTEITVEVFLVDIDSIDDVRQRFSVDLFLAVRWRDQRLALPGEAQSERIRTVPLGEIWTPRGLIINDRGLEPQLPLVASVDSAGNVTLRQRLFGELSADLDFREFPFDTQRLPVDFVSYQYSPDEIRFVQGSRGSASAEQFGAEGWHFSELESNYGEFTVPVSGIVRPRLTFFVDAQRNARYYMLTMFLPMSLVVFMSWTAFWIQPNVVPPRIAISTASIFSLIAFGFSIRLSLPRVSYVTRADMFVIGCTLLVFIALGIAVIGSRWAGANKMEQALRLNALTRWVYLGLFVVVATMAASI